MRSLIFLMLTGLAITATAQLPSGDYNVIFISVDDLKPKLGAYGDPDISTPNLDSFANSAVSFTNAHSQQAVCGPSRVSAMNGLRPDTTDVWTNGNAGDFRAAITNGASLKTLPQHFGDNGYNCHGFSKIFHGNTSTSNDETMSWNDGWTRGTAPFLYYESGKWELNDAGDLTASLTDKGEFNFRENPAVAVTDESYRDGVTAASAITQLTTYGNDYINTGQKFFLGVGFNKPHLPFAAPVEYWDLYNPANIDLSGYDGSLDLPINGASFTVPDAGELTDYTDYTGTILEPQAREMIHGYMAAVSFVDAQVGKVLDAIDTIDPTGVLRDNTIIVIWGDHGWHLADHGLWGKATVFEQATRMPLMIHAPGMAAAGSEGLECDAPVELIDMYPTLVDLAGLPQPVQPNGWTLDGDSLSRLLQNPSRSWKPASFSQYQKNISGTPNTGWGMGYSVRTDQYRYTEWYVTDVANRDTKAFATPEFIELYDYTADPGELTNVAGDEAATVATLATLLDGGNGWSTLNIPPNADTGGPYTSFPNSTITLDASGSNAGDAAITTYEWDLTNNGSYTDATGVTATHSFTTLGSFTIGLRVTDGNGEIHTTSTTVDVTLDPRISIWMMNNGETGSSTDASIDALISAISANIQEVWYTDTDVYVKATGIPSYNIGPWQANPNDAGDQDVTIRIPFSPAENTGTKDDVGNGTIGLHINGAAIFNASDAQFVDVGGVSYERNANVFEAASFDDAEGHPNGNDTYHHHQRSPSLLAQLGDDGSGHSPIIAFSYDGFPIYGPYGYDNTDGSGGIVRMESGYTLKAGTRPGDTVDYDGRYIEDWEHTNTNHLDVYNGRFAVTPEFPGGIYHYHATIDAAGDAAFPYFNALEYYGTLINANRFGNITIPGTAVQFLPPSASAGGTYNASVGSAIALSGSGSTAGNSAITTYQWDLDNDGKYDDATGATPSTTFFAVGTQTIGLRVIDANFAVSTATTTVEVTVAPGNPPTADAGGPYSANEGTAFTLDASGSVQGDAAIASYGWDLDGGGTYTDATGDGPSVTITDSDITSITVQVTASDNAVDTATATVTITNVAPTANAGGPYTGNTGVAITLDGSGSSDPGNDITDYDWDTDNNASYGDVTGVNASATFNTAGVYTIGLRVTDADGASHIAGTTTVTITDLTLIAPEQMTASDSDYYNKTMIRWHAVRGASLYRIYRHTADDSGASTDIGTTDAPMFLDTTGTAGTTYFYWVRAEAGATVGPLTASDQGTRAVGAQAGPIAPLEPPADPAGNATTAAKAALGKALFWDEQLSSTRTISCASCHQPEKGGLDPRGILGSPAATHPGPDGIFGTTDDVTGSPGVPGSLASGLYDWKDHFGIGVQATGRYPRPAIDAAYSDELFWDGRAGDAFVDPVSGSTILANGAALESQAAGPPVGDSEMAHNNRLWTEIVTRIDGATPLALATNVPSALTTWINGDQYNALFEEVYGDTTVTAPRIIMAIAAYERTLFSDRTNFDRVNAGIDTFNGAQNRGRGVFNRSDCRQCHSGNLGSDDLFHNIGIRPVNTDEDAGRFGVTGVEDDRGRFKTSHLRNVSLRGAFFHTGSEGSLADVIDFYDRGGDFAAANKDPRVRNLNLTAQEISDLTAFLNMWTDPRVENATDHFDRPTLYGGSAREPELYNAGIAGTGAVTPQVIAIEPPLGGNPNFTTGIYDGLAGAAATLIIDVDEPGDSIPDADAVLLRSDITLVASGDATGTGSAAIAIPDNPGTQLYGRWYVTDANGTAGVAATQPFRMTIFGTSAAAATPTADHGGPYTVNTSTNFTLDASSSSSGATIVAWEWDLDGDGNYDDGVGETLSHSYATVGVKNIGLKITDSNAAVATAATTVTVSDLPAPEIAVEQPVSTGLTDGIATIDAGSSLVGVAASALTFTIRNTGNADLTGLAASITGANSADFVAGALGATTLTSGQSTTFSVTFTPGASGARTAALAIASNDADENPFDITLNGTGTAPEIVVEQPASTGLTDGASTIAIGSSTVGVPSAVTVTIRNTGTAALTGLAASISGANSADFAAGALGANSLNPGESTTFSVTFTPSADGARTADLDIASNDSDENPFDIALTGTGVLAGPTADAAGPYAVNEGSAISLDASASTAGTGAITSYAWDSTGNAQYTDATGVNPSVTFPSSGVITIGVLVTDSNALTDTASTTVTVANVAPTAVPGGPYSGNEGSSIAFDGSGSTDPGNDISTYEWDWEGDGTYDDTGASANHTYAASGSYTARLRVTDADGAAHSSGVSVTVDNVTPTADAGGPYTATINVATTLDGSGSTDAGNDITDWDWDIDGDGQFDDASGESPSVTFTSLGTPTIRLRVTDADGASSSDDASVTVNAATGDAPVADAGGPYVAQPGDNVTLDASGSTDVDGDIASYTWDLDGNGTFGDATGVAPVVTSAIEEANVITVRVTDGQGNEGEATTVLTFKQDDIIDWTNLINVDASTNTLTKNSGGSAWNGNAWSTRALEEPGYITVNATRGGKRMIGLSLADGGAAINTIEYALYLNISALELYESGTHRGTVGTFDDGDDLRITIDGRDIVYSQNGTEIRRVIQAVPAGAFAYHADVSIETNGASLEGIQMVIPAPEGPIIDSYVAADPDNLNLFYSLDDTFTINFHQNTDEASLTGTQTKAEVDTLFAFSSPLGNDYAGSWHSAASYVISVLDPVDDGPELGVATATVQPGSNIFNAKAPLPADTATGPVLTGSFGSTTVLWLEGVNVLIEGAKVTRLFATNESWDSGAFSSRQVSTNAYIETTVTQLGKNRMIGFGKSNDDATHTDIDYAFFMHFSGALEVYQDGVQTGGLGRYAVGDVLKLEIDGLEMKYYKNDVLIRTDSITADEFPFGVDISMQNPLATIDDTILVIPDPDAPFISSVVANDPTNSDTIFGVGDTFTISMSGPTNAPTGDVADLFAFPAGIGTLSGAWTDSSTYVATVTAAGTEPTIGTDTVSPAGVTKIYYENTRVQAAVTAATITGHFGRTRNAISVAYANGLSYDLGQSYDISEVSLTYSGADSAITIETSTDGTSYSTANSATPSAGTSIHDVLATGRYLRISGITSLDAIAIYTQNALPATTWDHVDLRATITDGSITASFQSGKPYEITGLLTELPANLAAPTGSPVVVQSSTATSVTTTYFYSDGSTETITWDFEGGDLRCTTDAETQLPGIDLTSRSLVTVDADGRGVSSGVRTNHRAIALVESASDGWVIDGRGNGSFSYASRLTTSVSELRIRSYTGGDWQSAVTPHRTALGLAAVSSPVRAYSAATNGALVPSLTLLGPLTNTTDIATAVAAGYVVVADLASVSEADALTAGATVLYSTTVPANPATDYMSDTLTSGAKFALFDNPGHALGGYLFKGAIIVAPTGSMYAPTALADIDEFMGFGCYLPAYGVDSWNEIVAAAQANDIAPGDIVYETTATTRSMLYNATNYGTRHTGISSYSGAGALANWKFYTGSTHIGLDTASTYYFDPSLSLDPAASHIQAVPADFALTSQTNEGFTKLVLSGTGNLDFVVVPGDSVFFLDVEMPTGTGLQAIAGSATVRMVTDSDTLIHGAATSDILIGRFPTAGGINLVGDGNGTVHINGIEVYNSSGAFNIDLSAYSNQNVLIEFSGSFTARDFILTSAPPVADIGGPYSSTEGAGVTLSAANSFNAVTYLWDTDNDGSYDDATGSSIVFSTAVDGSYPIGLRIENGGQFDTASTTVEITNVAPTANVGGPYTSAPGVTATLDASGSSDPGSDIATYEWDTDGDGDFDDATGVTTNYTPIATGSHTVSVRVTDDDGASSSDGTTFFASNDVEFTAIIGLNVSGNDLSRSSGSGWTASAISVGTLEEDGYLEFTATLAGKAMVGLSENDTASHFSGIKYAFYKNINSIELYEYGVQKGSYGTFTSGDLFRITIDKGDVSYTVNGAEIRRVIANEPLEGFSFNADIAMEASGSAVQDVVLAIPAPENPEITDYDGFDPDNLDTVYGAGDTVSITFHQKTDMGGHPQDQTLTKTQVDALFSFSPAPGNDYTGYWSHPAIFVVQIVDPAGSAPAFGSASVQVAGTQPIYNSKVPLLATNDTGILAGHWGSVVVLWVDTDNVIVDGNEILRPSSAGEGWNAGGRSSRTFTGDAYMESIVTATGQNRMIGFSSDDSNSHFATLDFAIFLHASGTAEAYEFGVQRGNLGRYGVGDTIRLERDGSDMIYYVNGLPRRSTTVDPALGLQVDCSLYARNASFNNTILVLPDSVINASRLGEDEAIRDAISISLDEGWNLIGISLDLDDPNPDFLDSQTAEAGRAYWVFASRPATHILTGTQVAQPSIPADGLYAPVRVSPVPAGYTAFAFDDGIWRQLPAGAALQPGTGYQLQGE